MYRIFFGYFEIFCYVLTIDHTKDERMKDAFGHKGKIVFFPATSPTSILLIAYTKKVILCSFCVIGMVVVIM